MQWKASGGVLVLSDAPGFNLLVHVVADDVQLPVQETSISTVLADLVREPRPGVLVLDITVDVAPERWALLQTLAADPGLAAIRVVVSPVATPLLDGHARVLQRPGVRVWSEPFDPAHLLDAIMQLSTFNG